MGADLAVDKLEATVCIGDLLAESCCEFGEQVAMFAGGRLSIEMQMSDVAGEQCVLLCVERGDVALGVADLAANAKHLGCGAFPGDEGVDLAVIVEHALQGFGIAMAVGLIGASHQQGEVPLLGVVASEIRMDALGDIPKESLETGRRVELFSLAGLSECGLVSLLRTLTSLLSAAAGGVGVVESHFALGDARFKLIKFSVEDADLAKITAFKGLELGAELGKLRFALGKRGADSGKLLAFVEESGGVRGLLEDDFGWHAASRRGSSSLAERRVPFQTPLSDPLRNFRKRYP